MTRPLTILAFGLLAAAVFLLGGCAVGPDFKTPTAPPAAGYVAGAHTAATAASPDPGGEAQRFVDGLDIPGQWWTLFRSDDLNALITRAIANSPTLGAAQAALRQANENLAAERGSYYPSASASAQSERERASSASFGGIPGLPSAFFYSLNNVTVNVSYTLDVFGGIRRQVEALQAQADYERYAFEASYLSLTANIVTAAVTEASLRAQIAATLDIAASQRHQLEILGKRFTAGGSSRADVLQQEATLENTLASLPPLQSQLTQERNLLATYLGVTPAEYAGAEFRLDSLHLPDELPVSLPSKLVEQRPDVREYTALLHEATAQIGVATANLLPQITLSGSYGGEATKASQVFSADSIVWSLVGGVTQPIFKGGTLVHQRRAAVAAAQQAAANYQATVVTAFQNVANTLAALEADAQVFAADAAGERAARGSLTLVQVQFKSGAASYTQVLTAEQTYQNAAVALVKARAQRYADTAALFQALGGGWWNRTDVDVNAKVNATDCCKGSQ
jgi:NodT family efflux transporter outer membrane factor (OMF) lipoprotein